MNRKERRAAQGRSPGVASTAAASGPAASAAPLLAEASRFEQQGKLNDAVRLYKRALAIYPHDAQAQNNLACLLLAQGDLREASARFARSLAAAPELFEDYPDVLATLCRVNLPIAEALTRATGAGPMLLTAEELLGPSGLAAIAGDPMLRGMLEGATVRDVALERVMTSVRAAILAMAAQAGTAERIDGDLLALGCALARQCFINEYVFATSQDELAQVERLRATVTDAIASGSVISPLHLAALAAYGPLGAVPDALALLDRDWPQPVADLLTQQVREPAAEHADVAEVPRLTPIAEGVSAEVRRQYEESPYPRWVQAASVRAPVGVDDYLRAQFPWAQPAKWSAGDVADVLVAGCGTGRHSIEIARRFKDVRLIAIDLSLSSLCYARRKAAEAKVANIHYAQADILNLRIVDHRFDLIDAGGVLHHMADPMAGWRVLLDLLRPGGFMRLGLYSEVGRRDVVAARSFIADKGFAPTPDDIRRCRGDLLASDLAGIARYYDFFNTSECRDLLFHVQEHRLTLPAIASFLAGHGLTLIGFDVAPPVVQAFRAKFPSDRSLGNIDHWHRFETDYPDAFSGMYQFWVQKS